MTDNALLGGILRQAQAASAAGDDYIEPTDGLRYCGKCHTPKEAFFPEGFSIGTCRTHPTPCRCARERMEREEEQRRAQEAATLRARLRKEAFRDIPADNWRFDRAEITTPQLEKARRYAENWEQFRSDGVGLLLFGGVGTGKSYAAGCIANALIDQGISVLFLNMTDAVNRLQSNHGAGRESYLKTLLGPELLILDDLGAERSTSIGRERVFDVVNSRHLSGKPMLITTNLSLGTMKNADDLDDRRVFDRVLEVCVPVRFDGESFRRRSAAEHLEKAARLLV